ncbi:hypothetical protein FRC14_000873 [Serendipita sp. 396]|nr:hypothetical protein FRC14_000873 [Serendipita sp. 396]KAG8774867.1 hypothetical protein FRC15_000938 [Serendipita sp. 397]KAG8816692.1 hypothetical protein FRC18_000879 [Serendipita sp. 400]KAG8855002.1 hypothetical protein FRC20_000868 [Serendipita sp. 405]
MIMLDEVKVWFQDKDEVNPGRLVPPIPDDALSVQFVSEGSLNRIATYDKDGKWSLGS